MSASGSTQSVNDGEEIQQRFVRIWAVFNLAMFIVTWRLWFAASDFPGVPLLEILVPTPFWVDQILAALMVVSLLVSVFVSSPQSTRRCLLLFAVALMASLALNQHRLQPWAWHALIFALLMGWSAVGNARDWMRWVLISIYCYSAISKFDYQFSHTVGLQFLDLLAGCTGGSVETWSPSQRFMAVQVLPLGELLIGIGLFFSTTRWWAAALAIALHITLILLLGPLGLNHQPAVLIWNAMFAFQIYWLFMQTPSNDVPLPQRNSGFDRAARIIALFVLIFPATANFGVCDHWLAWELYAPRSSRVEVILPARCVDSLPESAREHAVADATLPGVVQLDLAAWSLSSLNAPVYPQDRFQLGAAMSLAQRLERRSDIRVTIKRVSHRWTGERHETTIAGDQLSAQIDQFKINVWPRASSSKPNQALSVDWSQPGF